MQGCREAHCRWGQLVHLRKGEKAHVRGEGSDWEAGQKVTRGIPGRP